MSSGAKPAINVLILVCVVQMVCEVFSYLRRSSEWGRVSGRTG